MIEQLWYTWSTVGFGDGTGFRVRAASAGFTDMRGTRFQELDKHLRYQLPLHADHYLADAETSPRCLALLNTPYERIIVHKSYVGKDAYGRPGVFFCHLLASFPQEIPAVAIIELWRSSFWQIKDPGEEVSIHLSEVDLDTMDSGTLNETHILAVQDYLPGVIYAFFALKERQKLYIAAKDDQVAALIWGLTRSLPQSLQGNVTFSTYESDILASPALIIGTDAETADNLSHDFPQTYESEAGFAVNCYQQPPILPEETLAAEYARFATSCQIQGDIARMITLLEAAESGYIQDAISFLEFTAITIAVEEQKLNPEKVLIVLKNPYLASAYLDHPKVQRVLVEEALTNPLWWEGSASRALRDVRNSAQYDHTSKTWQALNKLSKLISHRVCEALEANDGPQWYTLIEMLRIASPSAQNSSPWLMLLTRHCGYFDSQGQRATFFFQWQTCLDMLKDWASIAQHISDISLLHPWFPTNWEQFQTFLRRNLPDAWLQEALIQLLCDTNQRAKPYPKNSADMVKQYRKLFHETLSNLWKRPHQRDVVRKFFESLIAQNYQYKITLLSLLLAEPTLDQHDIESVLHLADIHADNIPQLVRGNIGVLIRVAQLSVGQNILQDYLNQFGQAGFSIQDSDIQIINTLYRQRDYLEQELASRIIFYHQVTVQLANLGNVVTEKLGEAISSRIEIIRYLGLDQRRSYMPFFMQYLLQTIQSNQTRLDSVIMSFNPNDEKKRYETLRYLASWQGSIFAREISPEHMTPFLHLAVIYTEHLPETERSQKLDNIFHALLDHADIASIQELDREVQNQQPVFAAPGLEESYMRWRQSFERAHPGKRLAKNHQAGNFFKKITRQEKKGKN